MLHTLHRWLWVNHLTSCLMFPVRVPAHILPCRDRRRQCLGAGSLRAGGVGEMNRQAALGCRKSGLAFLFQQLLPYDVCTPLSPWFGVSIPLSFNSKQWDWCNFDYNPSSWIAPVGSGTHTLTQAGLSWSQRSLAAVSSQKHLYCLLGHYLPGNQVPVTVNSSIFIIFKMELGGFGAVAPTSWTC